MLRFVCPTVAVVATALILPYAALSQEKRPGALTPVSKGIVAGEKFEGELGPDQQLKGYWRTVAKEARADLNLYQGGIPITLKAGQAITITARVLGQDRFVGIRLLDPAGRRIKEDPDANYEVGGTSPGARGTVLPEPLGVTFVSPKSTEITIKEVAASGKHTIVIVSNRVGAFTVGTSAGSADNERDALEKQLRDLRKKVQEVEGRLKELDTKRGKRLPGS